MFDPAIFSRYAAANPWNVAGGEARTADQIATSEVVEGLLPGVAGRRQPSGVHAHRVVTVHATLLTIAMTSPPKVSTPTITAAAIARPRRCRRTS